MFPRRIYIPAKCSETLDTILAFPCALFPTTRHVLLEVEAIALLSWVVFSKRISSSLTVSCWVWERTQIEEHWFFHFLFTLCSDKEHLDSVCPVTFFLLTEQANGDPLGWPGKNSFCGSHTNVIPEREYLECIYYITVNFSMYLVYIIMFPYLTVKPSSKSSCSKHRQLLD